MDAAAAAVAQQKLIKSQRAAMQLNSIWLRHRSCDVDVDGDGDGDGDADCESSSAGRLMLTSFNTTIQQNYIPHKYKYTSESSYNATASVCCPNALSPFASLCFVCFCVFIVSFRIRWQLLADLPICFRCMCATCVCMCVFEMADWLLLLLACHCRCVCVCVRVCKHSRCLFAPLRSFVFVGPLIRGTFWI